MGKDMGGARGEKRNKEMMYLYSNFKKLKLYNVARHGGACL